MGIINILSEQTANLIAAGEVAERPSSAVKELMENSIDAGAKSITLEIKNGGRTLIRVSDDGSGFLRDDIPKALLRHATSKISDSTGVEGIRSLGFRGEALAAISAVSRMEIISKSRSENVGTRLSADEDGVIMSDAGCPDGTTVVVRDIFYNTPARQKFLKRDATEGASCVAVAEKLALSHPEISFTVIADGEKKFITSGDGKLHPAVYSVLGREFARSLIECEMTYGSVTAKGYVTRPDAARGSRNMQIAFVNGRYVKSRTVQAAIEEAYKSYVPRGKYPGCVLFVTLAPELVDVNVHPAKTEIKFASEGDVFHAVYYAARNAVAADDEGSPFAPAPERPVPAADGPIPAARQTAPAAHEERPAPEAPARKKFVPDVGMDDYPFPSQSVFTLSDSSPVRDEPASAGPAPEPEQQTFTPASPRFRMIGQAYDAYLFVETDESVMIIDKHAAHERILYEKLAKSKELHVQELLTGIPVNVGREAAQTLLGESEALEKRGFAISDFGDGTVIVRTVPATLRGTAGLEAILESFARELAEGNGLSFEERCDRALYTVACKAALKAGIKNSPADDENVVRMLVEDPTLRYCPHGRPFIRVIPKREIEKYFDR